MTDAAEVVQKHDRPIFQTSIETRLLYDRIRKQVEGETVSYAELTEIIGQDVQGEGRSALNSARRLALRDHGIVTDAVRNTGIKRLSGRETVQSATATFTKVRRLAKRGAQRLASARDEELTEGERSRRDASMSALALVALMGKPKSVDRIAAANTTHGELPVAKTIELFRGPKPAS